MMFIFSEKKISYKNKLFIALSGVIVLIFGFYYIVATQYLGSFSEYAPLEVNAKQTQMIAEDLDRFFKFQVNIMLELTYLPHVRANAIFNDQQDIVDLKILEYDSTTSSIGSLQTMRRFTNEKLLDKQMVTLPELEFSYERFKPHQMKGVWNQLTAIAPLKKEFGRFLLVASTLQNENQSYFVYGLLNIKSMFGTTAKSDVQIHLLNTMGEELMPVSTTLNRDFLKKIYGQNSSNGYDHSTGLKNTTWFHYHKLENAQMVLVRELMVTAFWYEHRYLIAMTSIFLLISLLAIYGSTHRFWLRWKTILEDTLADDYAQKERVSCNEVEDNKNTALSTTFSQALLDFEPIEDERFKLWSYKEYQPVFQGSFYQSFKIADSLFIIAGVSEDEGEKAALCASVVYSCNSLLKDLVNVLDANLYHPHVVLQKMNQQLYQIGKGQLLMKAIVLAIQLKTGQLRVADANWPFGCILQKDQKKFTPIPLGRNSISLGLNATYETTYQESWLNPSDALCLISYKAKDNSKDILKELLTILGLVGEAGMESILPVLLGNISAHQFFGLMGMVPSNVNAGSSEKLEQGIQGKILTA